MENDEYDEVIGSSAAPYINSLTRRYGLLTQSFAISHPSLPNYLALTSGSTHGIGSDCTDCSVAGTNIATSSKPRGSRGRRTWRICPRRASPARSSGGYAKKHNPFAYYTDVTRSPRRCRRTGRLRRARERPARREPADIRMDLTEPVRRRARLCDRDRRSVPRAHDPVAAARARPARLSAAELGRGQRRRGRLLRRRARRPRGEHPRRPATCARARARRARSTATACSGASSARSAWRRWAARAIHAAVASRRCSRRPRACAERRRAGCTARAPDAPSREPAAAARSRIGAHLQWAAS